MRGERSGGGGAKQHPRATEPSLVQDNLVRREGPALSVGEEQDHAHPLVVEVHHLGGEQGAKGARIRLLVLGAVADRTAPRADGSPNGNDSRLRLSMRKPRRRAPTQNRKLSAGTQAMWCVELATWPETLCLVFLCFSPGSMDRRQQTETEPVKRQTPKASPNFFPS